MRRYNPIKALASAWLHIGGLSFPDKMPCPSYSIPAAMCKVGSRLREVVGSICEDCYACKGCYPFKAVQDAMARRWRALSRALEPGNYTAAHIWVDSFVQVLQDMQRRKGIRYFRWHDSGDLQSTYHLELICMIAKRCPGIKFWLPTREYEIVKRYTLHQRLPYNLCVRLSAHMVNGKGPAIGGLATSEVHTVAPRVPGTACPAYQNDGHCGECRKCWDDGVAVVSYPIH